MFRLPPSENKGRVKEKRVRDLSELSFAVALKLFPLIAEGLREMVVNGDLVSIVLFGDYHLLLDCGRNDCCHGWCWNRW